MQHEALARRLKRNHIMLPEVEEKLGSLRAGYRGEKTLNYFLGLLPPKKYHIFHDLRLPIGSTFFQIDAFLLTSKSGFIIDNKNYSGTLLLDKFQLSQEVNDTQKVYQNPISQTYRHLILLRDFLAENQMPEFPIENIVSFSNSTSVIKIATGYNEVEKRVCKTDNILRKIADLERYHKNEVLTQMQLEMVKQILLLKHTPLQNDILKMYKLVTNDILPGVQCPKCMHIPMIYHGRKWECPICNIYSIDAHIPAVSDYFLLIKPWITNCELRNFLQLPNPRATVYLLSLLNLPSIGANKGRIYLKP